MKFYVDIDQNSCFLCQSRAVCISVSEFIYAFLLYISSHVTNDHTFKVITVLYFNFYDNFVKIGELESKSKK